MNANYQISLEKEDVCSTLSTGLADVKENGLKKLKKIARCPVGRILRGSVKV